MQHLLRHGYHEPILMLNPRPFSNPDDALDICSTLRVADRLWQEAVDPKLCESLVGGIRQAPTRLVFQARPELLVIQDLMPFAHISAARPIRRPRWDRSPKAMIS